MSGIQVRPFIGLTTVQCHRGDRQTTVGCVVNVLLVGEEVGVWIGRWSDPESVTDEVEQCTVASTETEL